MGNVKASRWIDSYEYLLKTYGQEGIASVMKALNPEDRAVFEKEIVPIHWLPYSAYLNYMFVADRLLGKGDHTVVAEASRYTARKHFGGIYKIFISMTTPNYVLKRTASVWRQYFDVGKTMHESVAEKKSQLKLVEYPDIPKGHEFSHTPFMEEILRMSSAKNPRGHHPKCQARGDDYCLWEFEWD